MTIGEHILKRRLELGLFQKDVARLLRVDEMTKVNWEKRGTQPAVRCLPRIFEFILYVSELDSPNYFREKLIQYLNR